MKMETYYKFRKDLEARSIKEFEELEEYYKEALPIALQLARANGVEPMTEIMRVIETGINISVDAHKGTFKFYSELLDIE